MPLALVILLSLLLLGSTEAGELQAPRFRPVEIDGAIEIGYGVGVADVDGDRKPDILLADKRQIVWYRNPTWAKFVMAENLTTLDNVCIAATDIDGDGKAEVAVGAGWNPADTLHSGAVFYLVPPLDRTKKWEPVALPHEPTVHRMRWIRNRMGNFELVVVPLHGRGNQSGSGVGVKILCYKRPSDPRQPWKAEIVNESLHASHNFEVVNWTGGLAAELLVAAREGVFHLGRHEGGWRTHQLPGAATETGAGEVRHGSLPGGGRFVVTIEPMHGNQLVVYTEPGKDDPQGLWRRHLVDSSLKEGHALACGDFLRAGFDQIVVGWREKNRESKVGIKFFSPRDAEGGKWQEAIIDDSGVACEDLCLADLNSDGKLDIVAAGRATRNLKVFLSEEE